jgi:HK97 family phage prohead protease
MTKITIERRVAPIDAQEIREDAGILRFAGHAAVFNSVTDLGPFREQVAPGAFKKTINEADIAFLYNHEPDSVMARTSTGTLRLKEDRRGLATEADLDPADSDVQRITPKLRSGNVSQMSFAFRVVGAGGESWDDHPDDGGKPIRTLRELELFDVSPVTFPAYAATDGGLRSVAQSVDRIAELRGLTSSDEEESTNEEAPEEERQADDTPGPSREDSPPAGDEHSPDDTAAADAIAASMERRRKRLAYLATTLE